MDAVFSFLSSISWWLWIIIILVIRNIIQRNHTISHNYPIVGHFRYLLESIGPELRQYFVANNREELPFNRIEQSWIYASAKNENNYEGFGTDRDIYAHQHMFVNNAMFPYKIDENHPNNIDNSFLPCAKVIGAHNKRKKPYRPASIINVSAMSYGSLSAKAAMAFAMGADVINVAREAMMSIGCIEAQVCHTNKCPTGIATQSKWLQNDIDPTLKSVRLVQYFKSFRKEFIEITHAASYEHPCQFTMDDIEINVDDHNLSKELSGSYGYRKTVVPFSSMKDLQKRTHLGGNY